MLYKLLPLRAVCVSLLLSLPALTQLLSLYILLKVRSLHCYLTISVGKEFSISRLIFLTLFFPAYDILIMHDCCITWCFYLLTPSHTRLLSWERHCCLASMYLVLGLLGWCKEREHEWSIWSPVLLTEHLWLCGWSKGEVMWTCLSLNFPLVFLASRQRKNSCQLITPWTWRVLAVCTLSWRMTVYGV